MRAIKWAVGIVNLWFLFIIADNSRIPRKSHKSQLSGHFAFVCFIGPVNNGRCCVNCGRAEGGCLSVWRCGSSWVVSAPPCLLLWTHTARQPANLGSQPAAKREKTGNAQVRPFWMKIVGIWGKMGWFLGEYGSKLELWIGKIVLRREWCGTFVSWQLRLLNCRVDSTTVYYSQY